MGPLLQRYILFYFYMFCMTHNLSISHCECILDDFFLCVFVVILISLVVKNTAKMYRYKCDFVSTEEHDMNVQV